MHLLRLSAGAVEGGTAGEASRAGALRRGSGKISELRQEGFTLTEISEASQLSIGVVHKASKEGAWLRPETAERILELEVAPEIV